MLLARPSRWPAADRVGAGAATGDALRALLVSRLLVWAVGAGAAAWWGLSARATLFDPGAVTRPFGPAGDALAAPLARWDSVWFLAIANDGYPADDPRRAAFFPLYPLLVRAAAVVVREPIVAGALVSVLCFAVALVLLHRLTALELGPPAARPAVWAIALFPGAVFFSAVYSEALYLALSVGCLYAARTGRWAWAGALGALGAATRSAGLLLVVPLALMWLMRADGAPRRRARDAAWIALVPIGPASFCASLGLAGADALAPLHAQELWFREFAGPFVGVWDGTAAAVRGVQDLGSRAARADVVLFGFLLAAVPAVIGTLRRLPPAYGAYVLAALALPLSYPVGPQPLMSLPRFLAVLFPLFMWLGAWLSDGGRARSVAVLGPSAAGLAIVTAVFATWHWVA
ncbi:MAG TPA: mannosyltransferase family protein [Solirubrobacteraceae bacterium]|nr:mannosyltransferase family protein [Solirubrobacteraceae bacterium]